MTNEEMALAIQAGNIDLLTPLWEQTEKLIRQIANKFYLKMESRCVSMGVAQEDLYQQGYFAVLDAVKYFDESEKFKFVTYLNRTCQRYFYDALEMRSANWTKKPTPISLETPLDSDDESSMLIDIIPDQNAELAFEKVIDDDYVSRLRNDIAVAMTTLTEKQRLVINGLYFKRWKHKKLKEKGVASTDREHKAALAKLSQHEQLKHYRETEFVRYKFGYKRYGFRKFREKGMSSQERVVLELEKRGLLELIRTY